MSKVLEQKIELVPIDKLKPHPRNPRRGNVEQIAASIDENGFYRPVVVQRSTNYILAGNHSWEAAKSRGIEKIPTVYLSVDDKAALKILLADNKTNDAAGYDEEVLASILMEARSQNALEGTGYDEATLGELLTSIGNSILATAGEAVAETKTTGGKAGESEAGHAKLSGAFAYRVIVDCESEEHQGQLLEQFETAGLKCRPLIS